MNFMVISLKKKGGLIENGSKRELAEGISGWPRAMWAV